MPRQARQPKGFNPVVEQRVQEALGYIRDDGMAVRAAATKAQAPYSRVRGRLKGHEPTGTRGGANSNLSAEQETLVVNYIEVLDGIGLNPSTEMVKQAANHLLRIEFDALDLSQFQRSAHKAVKVVADITDSEVTTVTVRSGGYMREFEP